jgi:hypothetical protein
MQFKLASARHICAGYQLQATHFRACDFARHKTCHNIMRCSRHVQNTQHIEMAPGPEECQQ